MKTSRNDPCPCGSGRKYKACCMGRDQARAHARSLLGSEAFDQAEAEWMARAREEKVWAADVVPASGHVREAPDGISVAMLMAGEWVAHTEVLSHRPAGVVERARDLAAVVNAGTRILEAVPERVLVRDPGVAEALGRELAGRGISVDVGDSEHLAEALDSVLRGMDPTPAQGRMNVALTWRETGASAEDLADFHQAADAFYRAAPWEVDDVPETLLLEFAGEELPWAASLMGGGGQSFGLVLHSRLEDLQALWESFDPSSAFLNMAGFTLTVDFDRKGELTRTMQREISAAGWPIAGPRAYPRIFSMKLPGHWIGPPEIRRATQALRGVTAFALGGDALAQTGVGVSPFDLWEDEEDAEDDDSRLDWFNSPEEAAPIRAEGPGAQPRLVMWDPAEERMATVDAERKRASASFAEWLGEQEVPAEEAAIDLETADSWAWAMAGVDGPGEITEFDLRLFLYDIYVRKTDPAPEAVGALPRSMRRIVRWLEEREGVRYPFTAAVLDELDGIAARGRALDEPLEETLRMLSYDVYDDLDIRSLLPSSDDWPELMSLEVAQLREELQRRWLVWYDELVRGGLTNFGELGDVLLARQREWEATPHPQTGNRTPREVVADYLRQP
jgi:hypothetical protein